MTASSNTISSNSWRLFIHILFSKDFNLSKQTPSWRTIRLCSPAYICLDCTLRRPGGVASLQQGGHVSERIEQTRIIHAVTDRELGHMVQPQAGVRKSSAPAAGAPHHVGPAAASGTIYKVGARQETTQSSHTPTQIHYYFPQFSSRVVEGNKERVCSLKATNKKHSPLEAARGDIRLH